MANDKSSTISDDTSVNSKKPSTGASNLSFENQPSLQITIHKLNGQNFLQWSRSVTLYLRGRGLFGYLNGDTLVPEKTDSSFAKWDSENSLIMAWLINSMEVDIGKTYLFLSTAKELWEAVKEAYSDLENSAQVFELKSKLRDQRQQNLTVTQFYNALNNLWQEIDLFYVPDWKCKDDASFYQKMLDRERLFDFLHGLNRELDEVRGRILGKSPLPSVREAFAEVRREESRKRVMMGPTTTAEIDNSALSVRKHSALAVRGPNSGSDLRGTRKERPWCTHCNKPGHLVEKCWAIHGKPADWKPRAPPKQAHTAVQAEQFPFTAEQINKIHQLLNDNATSVPTTVSSKSGIPVALTVQNSSWIVDSGASDHMTGQSQQFTSYHPCPGNLKIRIADGTLSTVAGKGSVILSPHITLKNVLHVPNLACNLLSISKLAVDQNCEAKFSTFQCIFQDISSGKTIGSAKACSGLYYFDVDLPSTELNKNIFLGCNVSSYDDIMRWHYRLGHPSFPYMKHLFPDFFHNKSLSKFKCEVCEFAKHTRTVYRSRPYKASHPFSLIHSDIWGPSKVSKSQTRIGSLHSLMTIHV